MKLHDISLDLINNFFCSIRLEGQLVLQKSDFWHFFYFFVSYYRFNSVVGIVRK